MNTSLTYAQDGSGSSAHRAWAWKRAAELDERIEQLVRLRDDLGGCIGCGCLSLARCALFNPEDTLGQRGAGAHTLDTRLRQQHT